MTRSAQRPIRVLHVDDEPDFADMAADFLEREDDRLCVEAATSVSVGLDYLEAHDVDCIVSDYEMPGRDGIEFLDAVREDYPDLPFVLFTGKGSEEIASEAISSGVTDYLQKGTGPERYQLLANRITNAVAQYRAQRRAERAQRQLRQVIDLVPEPIFAKNEDGEFTLANEAFAEAYDTTPDEIEGTSEETVEPSERTRRFQEIDRELIEDGESRRVYEGEFHETDDRKFHQTFKIPFDVAGSDERWVLGYVRDVTELRERERELERRNERLEAFADRVYRDIGPSLAVARDGLRSRGVADDADRLAVAAHALDRARSGIDELVELAREETTLAEAESIPIADRFEECWQNVATARGTPVIETSRTIRAERSRFRELLETAIRTAVGRDGEDMTVRIDDTETGFSIADDGPTVSGVFDPERAGPDAETRCRLRIVERLADELGWEATVTASERGGLRIEITGVEFAA